MTQTIYCISGMGADERIFKNFCLKGYELKHIRWLRPHKDETIEAYAARMAAPIKEENAIILGVSFGGIMGIEIARQRHIEKLILVSSINSFTELPRWMRVAGKLKINKVVPTRPMNFTERFANWRLGVSNEEEKEMVKEYRKSADLEYIEWAVDRVINWRNKWVPENIIHIHGDSDKIFPIKNIKADYIIKKATHFMIYNRAEEVSECICKALGK